MSKKNKKLNREELKKIRGGAGRGAGRGITMTVSFEVKSEPKEAFFATKIMTRCDESQCTATKTDIGSMLLRA